MTRKTILDNENFFKVLGWFHRSDAQLFQYLLGLGNEKTLSPKYLEVGVFAGKSTILIGESVENQSDFYVCDIFENDATGKNSLEIQNSFSNLSRKRFESNYLNFHTRLPNIIEDSSLNLGTYKLPKEFTFIHIDGSHLYEIASQDLEFAVSRLAGNYGFLAVDDWRSPHTIGVTAALWKILSEGRAYPLIFTNQKFYLTKDNPDFLLEKIHSDLLSLNLETVVEEFLGFRALRVIDESGLEGFSNGSTLRKLIPKRIYLRLIASPRVRTVYQKLRGLK